jgi:methyl-accepting chemotaxis protein
MMRDNGWLAPTALMAAMATAATVSWASSGNGLSTRLTFAIALMGGVSVFAYQLAGHPWQIDMHMYFFAALIATTARSSPAPSRSPCITWR